MNRIIWKYHVPVSGSFELMMPLGAKILDVQIQHGIPVMWAAVDPMGLQYPKAFRIIGTGHPLEDLTGDYIGTFQLEDGNLAFHLFSIEN